MPPIFGVVLTVLFLVTGIVSVIRLVKADAPKGSVDRIARVLLIAISLAMIVVAWGVNSAAGTVTQLLLFGAFTVYFLVQVFSRRDERRAAARFSLLLSVATIAITVTMPVVTASRMEPSMPGMDMPEGMGGMDGMAMGSTAPAWTGLLSLAFGVALLVAAASQLSRALRVGSSPTASLEGVTTIDQGSVRHAALSIRDDAVCAVFVSVGLVAILVSML
ncbi:MAG: hypothetical protein ABS81_15745 [Pseudonocardia sp. SCN 72-86]|nr:MAG: hypothetical protein ABS81_15745 [Pseudonocardia sp. SCN 72-86]